MRPDIYNNLAPSLQKLVLDIEQAAGFEIEVKSASERTGHVTEDVTDTSDAAGAITSATCAIIEFRKELTHDDFAHELLHLHRFFVEKTPQFYPRESKNGQAAAALENWLEHVVIYGRQILLCPNLDAYLNSQMQRFWENFPPPVEMQALKFNVITRYMVTDLYGTSETKSLMRRTLERHPQPFSVRRGAKEALRLVGDKRKFGHSVLKFCGISPDLFYLRTFERGNPKLRFGPV